MPGSIRSMQLEHVLRNVQTDRGSLAHGRLLRWQFDTVTLAHRMPSGASTPSPTCCAANRMRRRIASPEMFPEAEMLPHLICSRPMFIGGAKDEADQHGGARRVGGSDSRAVCARGPG